ncbi:MAG: TIGR04053 family radical SAM/SPASM domain-containing protein [Nitrososphaerales archaeon]|nr:TIGR04053 family radical SAM/SPASM domain-containing protein [Nitrososphaerales archaeon]
MGYEDAKRTMDFSSRPILVFWETTRACPLACVHCRASAITEPLPGELTKEDGFDLIEQVASFGRPSPTVVLTGGDPLMRSDLFDLASYASKAGVQFAVSSAVTGLLTDATLDRIRSVGASSISVSLDGACQETHDSIRGVEGTFDRTMERIKAATELGISVQVNTAIMKSNFRELPQIFHLIRNMGVNIWELFFLVKVGRGSAVDDLAPEEYESVCNLLYDASHYGMTIRCVEAPFIRRVVSERNEKGDYWQHETYHALKRDFVRMNGGPSGGSSLRPKGTLDGDGIVFVGYDGAIYPGGFLPVRVGNVKEDGLVRTYRESDLMRRIRGRVLKGPCGTCGF